MFNHSPLPNVGLTKGTIPPEIYQALNKEIVDIHMASETCTLDKNGILQMNPSLAGQITKEYEITKSRQLLNPFLEEMGRQYQKHWNYYPQENPNDNNQPLTIQPENGMLLIWPALLHHEVPPTKGRRMCISMNIGKSPEYTFSNAAKFY